MEVDIIPGGYIGAFQVLDKEPTNPLRDNMVNFEQWISMNERH
jgi:hypothetical protein